MIAWETIYLAKKNYIITILLIYLFILIKYKIISSRDILRVIK
jgi:hypothetical protein